MNTQPCLFRFQKHIPNFPQYCIDTTGELYNLDKMRAMAHSVSHDGYHSARACRKKIHQRYLLHRLVLSSFKGHAEGMVVDHIDNDRANNNLSNLRWVTQSFNVQRSYDQGRSKSPKAMTGKCGKLHHASKPVGGFDLQGNMIVSFESVSLANNAGYNNICRSLKNGKTSKGLKFRYL